MRVVFSLLLAGLLLYFSPVMGAGKYKVIDVKNGGFFFGTGFF